MARNASTTVGGPAALQTMVADQKRGRPTGIYSICSANRWVLEAAMIQAKVDGSAVLIESTSNQVNQFGGYIGMTAAQFAAFCREVAGLVGFPTERIILGGDHLGPNVWQKEPAATAMPKALELVRSCVRAGYTKIHLDASMRCGDDPGGKRTPLSEPTITTRAADMAAAAEEAHALLPAGTPAPVYVIGTEVPVPGGEQANHAGLTVTRSADLARTIDLSRQAFKQRGLEKAWERVIAVVVQPGVEFGDATVIEYDRSRAQELSARIRALPGVVFEAHSTDYQQPQLLRQLVEDQFCILKVGPWLTFALREAAFALENIEIELLGKRPGSAPSRLRQTLEQAMLDQPGFWQSYYKGTDDEVHVARQYSYSDRCRYYWPQPPVQAALARLLANLSARPIPLTLLSQYLPRQYAAVRAGQIANHPRKLILHKIMGVTTVYARACGFAPPISSPPAVSLPQP